MSLAAAQSSAFLANAGFTPAQTSAAMLGIVFAVLLLYGAWALRAAYAGWAAQRLSSAQFALVLARFMAMYLGLGFFLL
jgi:integrating conjugative element protein (TIGR03758 family)